MCGSIRMATGLLMSLLASVTQAQTTLTVTSAAANGPGTLDAAVTQLMPAVAVQVIRFQLPANSVITLNQGLQPIRGIEVLIEGADTPGLVIDGNNQAMFRVESGGDTERLTLRNLILRRGSRLYGGCLGVRRAATITEVQNLVFEGCRAAAFDALSGQGGAIYAEGPLSVSGSRFIGNEANDNNLQSAVPGGGAIAARSSVAVTRSHFEQNRILKSNPTGGCPAGDGGAVALFVPPGLTAQFSDVSFVGNWTQCLADRQKGRGGALLAYSAGSGAAANLIVSNTYFGQNEGGSGGAMLLQSIRLTMQNTSFFENIAVRGGGLIAFAVGAQPADLGLSNLTFHRNSALIGSGADLDLGTSLGAPTPVRQMRNLLFGPPLTGESCAESSFNADAGEAVFVTGNSCFVSVAGNLISAQFPGNHFGLQAPAMNGGYVPTLDITAGSPAIDNGSFTLCPTFDARGVARPYDGDVNGVAICDVGAVEFRPVQLFGNGFENTSPSQHD
jgi:hypothetical protein